MSGRRIALRPIARRALLAQAAAIGLAGCSSVLQSVVQPAPQLYVLTRKTTFPTDLPTVADQLLVDVRLLGRLVRMSDRLLGGSALGEPTETTAQNSTDAIVVVLMIRRAPRSTLLPDTTLFRSRRRPRGGVRRPQPYLGRHPGGDRVR